MKKVYVCSDDITGIFSAVYDAWKGRSGKSMCEIAVGEEAEPELFCEYRKVRETDQKARAVERMIIKNLGWEVYRKIYYAALSESADKGTAILGTLLSARNLPDAKRIMEHLSNPYVVRVFELSRMVGNEAHLFTGFVRFRELEGGILYAEISPKNQVLPCLGEHFQNRLPLENWMIRDLRRNRFVIHEAEKRWILLHGAVPDGNNGSEEGDVALTQHRLQNMTKEENAMQELWKIFCDTIAIKERNNPACQRTNLPLRYRLYMTEFGK